jgi:hypothetical protein
MCAVILESERYQREVEGRVELTGIVGSCRRQRRCGVARFVHPGGSRVRRIERKQRGVLGLHIGVGERRIGQGINRIEEEEDDMARASS